MCKRFSKFPKYETTSTRYCEANKWIDLMNELLDPNITTERKEEINKVIESTDLYKYIVKHNIKKVD